MEWSQLSYVSSSFSSFPTQVWGDLFLMCTTRKISTCFQRIMRGILFCWTGPVLPQRKNKGRHVSIHWIPMNKLVLRREEMLWIVWGTVCESGELTEEGSVKDKRETFSDKNSPREPEILIIQKWEPLILDQWGRLLEPLLTVTYRVCLVRNGVTLVVFYFITGFKALSVAFYSSKGCRSLSEAAL